MGAFTGMVSTAGEGAKVWVLKAVGSKERRFSKKSQG